jgi:5-formyltetrahydrofolate cyclo-ligase
MTPTAIKSRLRREVRRRILSLDRAERDRQECALRTRIDGLPGFGEAETVLLYMSAFAEEISTRDVVERALASGRRVICPRVDRTRMRLTLHRVTDLAQDCAPGVLGIPEPIPTCAEVSPDEIDWALIPGLAFDRRRHRLGRGAGHYDRLLPSLRLNTPKWALALDVQILDELPVEPHDQPLDGVLTASGIIDASGVR